MTTTAAHGGQPRSAVSVPLRQRVVVLTVASLAFSVSRAGLADVVNIDGWSSFARFWTTVVRPETSAEFLRLTWDAALQTLAFAVLGSALALLIGAAGALVLSQRMGGSAWRRRCVSVVAALPRAVHEILIGLLLVQVFGFDPIVAVLAIGIPFGAVTAKVFADAIDDADQAAFNSLRASGASRFGAVMYGIGPQVRTELVGYGFYRLECAIRSAAVLGIAGVGGLGFQLDLSFESLRYEEIWTLIAALMLLSGGADAASSSVRLGGRRAPAGRLLVVSVIVLGWASWQVGLDVGSLWSERTRARLPTFANELLPLRLGPGGWGELGSATLDTVGLAVLALMIAVIAGLLGAVAIRRPTFAASRRGRLRRSAARLLLLMFRAVPAPIWAFLFVLILFPGLWPGAVALGVYNAGVLGRLFAEAIESQPVDAERSALLAGANRVERWCYGVLPQAAPRLTSLAVYRGEVIVRETIIIGVVGAGGLGQLVRDHLVARDFGAVTGVVIVLVALAASADALGTALRRSLS